LFARPQFLDHSPRTIDRRTFLITGDEEGECATVIGMLCHKRFYCGYHGGKPAFHISSATTVQQPIANSGRKRI